MSSPHDAEALARAVAASYEAAETAVIETIARRVAKGIEVGDEHWLTRKLAEVRTLRRQVEVIVARLERSTPDGVQAALRKARSVGLAQAKADLAQIQISAPISTTVNEASVVALAGRTTQSLQATHLRILRSADDVYREAVAEAARTVLTGTETRRQASQRVLDTFANRGVTGFIDKAGRSWNLASYSEMAMRSATGQAAVQGTLDGYVAAGRDLVMISDSPEECELCRPWEGRVLSIAGKTPDHATVADAEAAGLFHPGCTHRPYLYTPGLTRRPTQTENPQGYEDRQEQRHLERGIRQWKRREAAALDDVAGAKAQAKVREWQGRMRGFIDETDRLRDYGREQIKTAI